MKTARTTIELDRELLKTAKQKAIEEDKSLKKVISEALEKQFSTGSKKKRPKFRFKAYDMGVIKMPLTREQIYEDI